MTLVEYIKATLRVPKSGGWATNPEWDTKRLVQLKCSTLKKLKPLAKDLGRRCGMAIAPMTLAAVLLERALDKAEVEEVEGR